MAFETIDKTVQHEMTPCRCFLPQSKGSFFACFLRISLFRRDLLFCLANHQRRAGDLNLNACASRLSLVTNFLHFLVVFPPSFPASKSINAPEVCSSSSSNAPRRLLRLRRRRLQRSTPLSRQSPPSQSVAVAEQRTTVPEFSSSAGAGLQQCLLPQHHRKRC